jgi:anti-sigma-K factor RskA
VVKEYVGRGLGAVIGAELGASGRAEREAERQAKAAELERVLAAAEPLTDLFARIEALATEALTAAGFHLRQGDWRRARTWRSGGK